MLVRVCHTTYDMLRILEELGHESMKGREDFGNDVSTLFPALSPAGPGLFLGSNADDGAASLVLGTPKTVRGWRPWVATPGGPARKPFDQ